ncbi:MAG TPA: class I SAM-dependent methyltransferase [Ruminiclostridium sp.]|nr:class I SAM-dependent methyltransferase [Ruminiclostridium sp.]
MSLNGNWSDMQPTETLELSREFIFTEDLLPLFSKYTGAYKGGTLVDLGCGTGTFSRYLAKGMGGNGKVIGVDLDTTFLDFARSKAEEQGLSQILEFKKSNAYELPFEDGSIDSITDHTLLINLDDPDRCIKEELRVLKDGGTISTATFIWGYFPPQRLISSPEYDPLVKTQATINKIYKELIFPQVPIGANDYNVYSIMGRYTRLGVKDVQINGLFPLFSPDDSRYLAQREQWLTNMYRLQRWEIDNFQKNISLYEKHGLTPEELELAAELLEKRYKYELENTTWILFNGVELIISGKK